MDENTLDVHTSGVCPYHLFDLFRAVSGAAHCTRVTPRSDRWGSVSRELETPGEPLQVSSSYSRVVGSDTRQRATSRESCSPGTGGGCRTL